MANAPASAGTTDTRVDRPDEGLPGLANVANPSANPPTRASLDTARANTYRRPLPRAVIDTSGTSGLTPDADIKRGEPLAWV
jgi:hypothetical protein